MSLQFSAECWHEQAQADAALCRAFDERLNARLERSWRCQRVSWERMGHDVFGLLLPDPLPQGGDNNEWFIYYPWGEMMLRRTAEERRLSRMIILAESADDWAALLRMALHDQIVDSRYEITPDYTDALGETENVPCGYLFSLFAHVPCAVQVSDFQLLGRGETPAAAARDACRLWLEQH